MSAQADHARWIARRLRTGDLDRYVLDEAATLLAELARLEQERDIAKEQHANSLNRMLDERDSAEAADREAIAQVEELSADLAAARAREQRLREALGAVVVKLTSNWARTQDEALPLARAALAAEPTADELQTNSKDCQPLGAATLAEPEGEDVRPTLESGEPAIIERYSAPSRQEPLQRAPAPSGSASAAADERPAYWPNNETGGAQTTPFPTSSAAADEPGERE